MPWLDPAGRFSAFKSVVFALLFVPAILIAFRYAEGALGARPINEAIHEFGNWTLKLVLASLAISPGRKILKWPRLMLVRRMVGVAAFAYAAAHLSLYVVDQEFDLRRVAVEIALRFYLTIGFVALMVLAAMAATSADGMARRLGGKRWRRLHRLIYPAALLMVVHFFIETKVNADEPWVMAGLYGCLIGYRVLIAIERRAGPLAEWWPLVVAALATCGTAIGEALYFWIKFGADPLRVLAADLTFTTGIRPAWTVLAICVCIALAALLRRLPAGSRLPSPQMRCAIRFPW